VNLIVNGKPRESAASNLMDVWREETADLEPDSPVGFAIALNGRIVRKPEWEKTILSEQDRIEIVRAMQGG
jgi:sulfur carrier protein